MKKGDMRKQEIMNTAETLFCKNGFEQTSIQDILDLLKISKGSFYHHFLSKETLLEEICRKRAKQIFESVSLSISAGNSHTDNLNTLFSGMIPLTGEKLGFLMMLLPVLRLPEGTSLKACFCESLSELFRASVIHEIDEGCKTGTMFCLRPSAAADICLHLINKLWLTICELILTAVQERTEANTSELLTLSDEYRFTIEKILTLPYGSMELISIPALRVLCEQIGNHWKEN